MGGQRFTTTWLLISFGLLPLIQPSFTERCFDHQPDLTIKGLREINRFQTANLKQCAFRCFSETGDCGSAVLQVNGGSDGQCSLFAGNSASPGAQLERPTSGSDKFHLVQRFDPNCGPADATDAAIEDFMEGKWTTWSLWGECPVTCGISRRFRERQCLGDNCLGPSDQEQPCDAGPCSEWGSWNSWEECSATCGSATKRRTRKCENGFMCFGQDAETQNCGTKPCSKWTNWGQWGECTTTCGLGSRERSRQCLNGNNCDGDADESQPYWAGPCPTWAGWTEWTACSVTCGQGKIRRNRRCLNGIACDGKSVQTSTCDAGSCCVLAPWSSWSSCTISCGTGQRNRERKVIHGDCQGRRESQDCDAGPCAYWGKWTRWSNCDCKTSQLTRSRQCENGRFCIGSDVEKKECLVNACKPAPSPCGWTIWDEWETCSVTCGSGKQLRHRHCYCSGNGGRNTCVGLNMEDKSCSRPSCAPVRDWNSWAPWGPCTVTCDSGQQTRSRTCATGQDCEGPRTVSITCLAQPCQALQQEGIWSDWAPWTGCSVTCGDGIKERSRLCNGGSNCLGSRNEINSCFMKKCDDSRGAEWSKWSPWGQCSVTCSTGVKYRYRKCSGLGKCQGNGHQESECYLGTCDTDFRPATTAPEGLWEPWGPWRCTVTCGAGIQTRVRKCVTPDTCTGAAFENGLCQFAACIHPVVLFPPVPPAPVPVPIPIPHPPPPPPIRVAIGTPGACSIWTPWNAWGPCSSPCGLGKRRRSRQCFQCQVPGTCRRRHTVTTMCQGISCGQYWRPWQHWTPCSPPCGQGVRARIRSCNSGQVCHGPPRQTAACLAPHCLQRNALRWAGWRCTRNGCR